MGDALLLKPLKILQLVKKSSIATDPTSEGKNEFQMNVCEGDLLGINFNIHSKYKFAKLHFVSIRHSTQERQEMLKSQYHFTCTCNSCSEKELIHFQERFSALKCIFCGGPIQNPHSEASLNHKMPCMDCGKEQEYKTQIEQVFLAYDLFKKVSLLAFQNCIRKGYAANL